MRIKLRTLGSPTGKVAKFPDAGLDREQLVRVALKKLKVVDDGGRLEAARFFLEDGDEVDAEDLENGDVVYVSFDGSNFAGPAATSAAATPSPARAVSSTLSSARSPSPTSPLMSGNGKVLTPASHVPRKLLEGKQFAAFISHAKAEAAMEARFVQSWLEDRLSARVFLDSDNLRDLTQLERHVKESAVLVLIQSRSVLTRPWCVLELLTAIKYQVPIVGLCLVGVGRAYDFADAAHWLTNLDTELEDSDFAHMLAEHGFDDLTEIAYQLSNVIPARISIPLMPGASAAQISATLENLVEVMAEAEPVDWDSLPKVEAWLRRRRVKAWGSWDEALADHRVFASEWFKIMGAYVGPNSLDPDVAESVMLAVNSINSCPFCSGLHCDLARIAGTKRPYKIDKAKSLEEVVSYCDKRRDQVAVRYARVFAMTDGRGKKSEEAYEKLVSTFGEGKAQSIRALCWFLYWGSYTGNTLNAAIGYKTPKPGTLPGFQVQIMAYYGLLFFGAITTISALLKVFPSKMPLASPLLGIALGVVGGAFFIPLGIFEVWRNPNVVEAGDSGWENKKGHRRASSEIKM